MFRLKLLAKAAQNPALAASWMVRRIYNAAFGSRSFTKFIIVSRSRSGSNLLNSLLNSHPNVVSEGEIFGKLSGRSPEQILRKTFRKQSRAVKAKGFKIFYYHPMDEPNSQIWSMLQSMSDVRVIHLRRNNLLQTAASRKLAGIQDTWAIKSNDNTQPKASAFSVAFTREELVASFVQTKEWEAIADQRFSGHSKLEITYEELVQPQSQTMNTVFEFLGVPRMQVVTNLKKQQERPMRDVISNYSQLEQEFRDTEWSWLFKNDVGELEQLRNCETPR